MSVYVLYLVKYNDDQKAARVATPSMRDRAGIHKKAIADCDRTPVAQFGSYGEYDVDAVRDFASRAPRSG